MLTKKTILLAILISIAGMSAYSQKLSADASKKDTVHRIDVEARVDAIAWKKHLESQMQGFVDKAASKGLPAGVYTINVRFLVDLDGSITDVEALNDIGYGLKKAVEKIIRTAPKWIPGTQNGVPVRSYHTQPVNFQIVK